MLLCSNSTGTDNLKPFLTRKYNNTRYFKNIESLPDGYAADKKSWKTRILFNKWLLDFDRIMQNKKKKIALIIDNCSPSINPPNMKNTKMFYFLPSCTLVLQPLDLGIIKFFEGYCSK